MLLERFSKDGRIKKITALDMRDPFFKNAGEKVSYIKYNLGDPGWEERVLASGVPDVVIHSAYVIREGYGKKRKWQIKSNITAARRLFDFIFKNNIPRLIHFSTVASYGALPSNTIAKKFREEDVLRESKYLYGADKKNIEEMLKNNYEKYKPSTQVFVIRPCAITGPRGQFIFKRFGLLRAIKFGLPFVPITGKDSARQYVHEDDIFEVVRLMVYGEIAGQYEVFNLAPGDFLLLKDMARSIGKISVRLPMFLGKLVFWALWHATRGKIPTVPASINSYTYPIIADGSKITRFGFQYKFSAAEALKAENGYYKESVHSQT